MMDCLLPTPPPSYPTGTTPIYNKRGRGSVNYRGGYKKRKQAPLSPERQRDYVGTTSMASSTSLFLSFFNYF
jgi:hypothetical protein